MNWTHRAGLASVVACLAFAAGCGDQGVETDPTDAPAGRAVAVSFGGDALDVTLADCPLVDYQGASCARLNDVVEHAFADVVLADIAADFEAADGFRPASKDNCAPLVPVPGDILTEGYIETETGNLQWAEALAYPGCLHLRDTVLIEIVSP
jgi:hypothetical protein